MAETHPQGQHSLQGREPQISFCQAEIVRQQCLSGVPSFSQLSRVSVVATPWFLSRLHVPQTSHADPLGAPGSPCNGREHPGSKNVSTPQGRDIRNYCGSTGDDKSAQASGKVIREDEFGFALEGTRGRSLVRGEPLSCGNGTTAEPSKAWSNSTSRSCTEKLLTAWGSASMQENTCQRADSEAHV